MALGEDAFHGVNDPIEVDGQRASGLRFADVAVQALLSALLVFRLLPRGFSNRDVRDHWAALLGKGPDDMTPGQMTYHLRRLRLHGLSRRSHPESKRSVYNLRREPPLKSVRNRHQTNTILNTSHEPKSTTVFDLKYRSYDMFTIIQRIHREIL